MRRICVITGTRAEYGLLKPIIGKIEEDEELTLQLIVTAMHLSPEFGLTYQAVEADGYSIDKKIETVLSSDTSVGIAKSMGLTQISFAEAFDELNPDLIVVLGDRSEIFAAVSVATVACIPVAHIHGGELSFGAYDDAFRHSISKMSHLHFTSTEEYRNRVIQLGENPSRVFNVGAIGLDNIIGADLMSKQEFEASIDFRLGKRNILLTYHPVTLENATSKQQFSEITEALDGLSDTAVIMTYPNSDKDGRVIIKMIEEYVSKRTNCIAIPSLGLKRYLSALQYVDVVMGNSSSGIIEVPYYKIPTVNIGDRQKGRTRCSSIIDCEPHKNSIKDALEYAYSDQCKEQLAKMDNPYGDGTASSKILEIIKTIDVSKLIMKEFFDIPFTKELH